MECDGEKSNGKSQHPQELLLSFFSLISQGELSKENISVSGSWPLSDSLTTSLSFSFLKNQIQIQKSHVRELFKNLKNFMEIEELSIMENLDREEKAILDDLGSVEDELAQQNQLVRDLVSELERRLQGSTVDLLQVRLRKKPQHLRFEKSEDQVSFSPTLLCSSWW